MPRRILIPSVLLLFAAAALAGGPYGADRDPGELEAVLSSVTPPPPAPVAPAPPPDFATRDKDLEDWTLIFYCDADFTYAYDPSDAFKSDARIGPNLSILVVHDTSTGPCRLYRLTTQNFLLELAYWGESDMGSGQTLADAVLYAKQSMPSDRYAVAMYDHGGGWYGACVDVTNQGWMTMHDMAAGLSQAGGIDLLLMTAPCIMGSFEAVHELRDAVDVYVASEELSGYAAWDGMMGAFCDLLNTSGNTSTEAIALQTLDLVWTNQPASWMSTSSYSACDPQATPAVADALHRFASICLADPQTYYEDVAFALSRTARIGEELDYDTEEVDLYDLARATRSWLGAGSPAHAPLTDVMTALDDVILGARIGADFRQYGLSIAFPDSVGLYKLHYPDVGLDLTEDTYWDEFIWSHVTRDQDTAAAPAPGLRLAVSRDPDTPGATRIAYDLPAPGPVTLDVFDIAGRRVRRLVDGAIDGGGHVIAWNGLDDFGRNVASGTYLIVLVASGERATAKAALVR